MKWLSVHVGGQKWRVDLVRGKSHHFEGDETCYGATYCDKCRIYIAREQDEQAREDTLLHELLHATLHVSGVSAALAAAGLDEEQVIKPLVPVWHRLLKDLGFRFPKGPNE